IIVNGVERDATPEEEAAILAQQEIDSAPKPPTYTPPQPRLVATALLTISDGEINGVAAAAGLAFGIAISTGLYWLFFAEEMPNTNYAYTVTSSEGRATITDRQTSYLE